jgi:hypothetical protein
VAAAEEVETAAGVRAYQASKAGQVNAEIGLPEGWRAVWSTSRARWYWRSESGEVAWTKPERLSAAKSSRSLGVGAAAAPTAPAPADAAAPALPPGWPEHMSRSKGIPYWKHEDGRTAWELPSSS